MEGIDRPMCQQKKEVLSSNLLLHSLFQTIYTYITEFKTNFDWNFRDRIAISASRDGACIFRRNLQDINHHIIIRHLTDLRKPLKSPVYLGLSLFRKSLNLANEILISFYITWTSYTACFIEIFVRSRFNCDLFLDNTHKRDKIYLKYYILCVL